MNRSMSLTFQNKLPAASENSTSLRKVRRYCVVRAHAIDGDGGNDTVSGGAGTNDLFGNAGVDTLVVSGTITSITRLSLDSIRVVGSMGGIAFDHTASGFEQVLENSVLESIAFFM
jgi:hypothetical protein